MSEISQNYLKELQIGISTLCNSKDFENQILQIAKLIISTSDRNKIIVIYGNGGSAADAQHFSAELVGIFKNKKRRSFKSIALSTDSSFLTAWANDFDFSTIFQRQIESLSTNIGLSIGLSTSGKSPNVLKALQSSKTLGIKTILISGLKSPEYDFTDEIVRLPSSDTSIIQTYTQIMYHLVCIHLESLC